MRTITDDERRARLARRHRVRPGDRATTVEEAAAAMVCLHATDLPTVYLSAFARVEGLRAEDVDRALYVERTLLKQLAMRRTLFVFPRATWPIALAACSKRVAVEQRRLIIRDVERAGSADGEAWFEAASAAVLGGLAGDREATAGELREELAEPQASIAVAFAPRVLTALSAAGQVMRGNNDDHWRLSKPLWCRTETWLDDVPPSLDPVEAHAELVRLWLRTFGPGTDRDIAWWLGGPLGAVRTSLATIGAVAVALTGGTGYVLHDDVEGVAPVEPWTALLPVLDPTTMGWQERGWYLGEHKAWVFDAVGNAGTTAWWDGRIVGGWYQDPDGAVVVALLEDVGAEAMAALDVEAVRLTDWLGGIRLSTVWASPLMKARTQGLPRRGPARAKPDSKRSPR